MRISYKNSEGFPVGFTAGITAPVWRGPVAQAEACATQDLHTPQRNSTQQADIVEKIHPAPVRYPGQPNAIRPAVGYIR